MPLTFFVSFSILLSFLGHLLIPFSSFGLGVCLCPTTQVFDSECSFRRAWIKEKRRHALRMCTLVLHPGLSFWFTSLLRTNSSKSFLLPRLTVFSKKLSLKEIKSFRRKNALGQTKSSFLPFAQHCYLFMVNSGYLKGCVKSHLYSRM